MESLRATPASPDVHVLGEGPFWDPIRGELLWVDVNGHAVLGGVVVGDAVEPRWRLDLRETVGAVVRSETGRTLIAGAQHLHTVGPDGSSATGIRLVREDKDSRLNDGGCDPAGRFLVGTLPLDDRSGDEELLRVEGGEVTVLDGDLSLSNGLAWSLDGGTFYSIDTTPGLVHRRSYDVSTGACGPREVALRIEDGNPDGMCVDAEGNLWIAIFGGGRVRRYSPAGELLATVEVAAPNTSSVAFAGPDLDLLVITTASEQLSDEQRARYPDSGRLFSCRVGVAGAPVPYWSGG